ncbi:MAG: FxsA family protein [Pseudomonadales bacterium]|jgi:UPF0716 family protein affecting phage T7 exclusion
MIRNPIHYVLIAECLGLVALGLSFGFPFFLLEILITGFLGYGIIRRSGQSLLASTRQVQGVGIADLRLAPKQLLMMFAGVCLLLPGLLTDLAGVALFLWAAPGAASTSQPGTGESGVIEGEFETLSDSKPQLPKSHSSDSEPQH